jgi:hypothetical protein
VAAVVDEEGPWDDDGGDDDMINYEPTRSTSSLRVSRAFSKIRVGVRTSFVRWYSMIAEESTMHLVATRPLHVK